MKMILIKIGYAWPHASPGKDWKVMKVRCKFILREDSDDVKIKMGEKITLVLFHKPCRKKTSDDEMTE